MKAMYAKFQNSAFLQILNQKLWFNLPVKIWVVGFIGLFVFIVGFIYLLFFTGSGDARIDARGTTSTVTVPQEQPLPGGGYASVPRPATLPPVVEAQGECKVQLDKIRDLIDRVPSGLMPLDSNDQTLLYDTLAAIGGAGSVGVCPLDVAKTFRMQELAPWMSWQVPSQAVPAPTQTPSPPEKTPTEKPTKKSTKK